MKKKFKTVGIHDKPEVDLDKLENLAREEEEKVAEIEKVETPPEKPKVPVIDYENKWKESQKEALILNEQLKKIEEEKNKKIDITDDFLKGKYVEWDELTIGEQKAIRKSEELAQEIQELKNTTNQYNNDRKWQEKVDTFVGDELPDLFPKIVGREEEFRRFATRPTRKGLPMDDLAKIFLFENPAIEKKRSLFHAPGSAGKPPENEGMSADDARELRVSKPLEYMRLVREGKIKLKI